MISLNDRLVVEVYKTDGSIKTEIRGGLAFAQQKTAVKGLKILVDAVLSNGRFVSKGEYAYIREEHLHNQDWAKKPLSCDALSEPFLIVDLTYVQFIGYKVE